MAVIIFVFIFSVSVSTTVAQAGLELLSIKSSAPVSGMLRLQIQTTGPCRILMIYFYLVFFL